MNRLTAETLPEIDAILINNEGKKLVLNGIENGNPEEWDQSEVATLESKNLRLVAATMKLSEEGGEVLQAVKDYIQHRSSKTKDTMLTELADIRRAYRTVLEVLGVSDLRIEAYQIQKEDRLDDQNGGFSRWIFMRSKKREQNG